MEQSDEKEMIELGKKCKELIIIMRPTNFDFNEEAAQDNNFMVHKTLDKTQINKTVIEEHKNFEKILRDHKVPIKVFEQTNPQAYDSLFISDSLMCIRNQDFPKGVIFIMPMYWKSRRLEKHPEIYKWLQEKLGYETIVDLSYFEKEDKALEGKGVTLFDWEGRTVYVGTSARAHKDVIYAFVDKLTELSGKKYEAYLIESFDKKFGHNLYHTSAYMMIYSKCAVLCPDVIKTQEQVDEIVKKLEKSGKKVFLCSYQEMDNGVTLGIEFFREDGKNGILLADFNQPACERNMQFYEENFNELIWISCPTIFLEGGGEIECLCQTVPLI